MSPNPQGRPARDNDYLGTEPLPSSIRELAVLIGEFFDVTENQIGMLNATSGEGFLNEQRAVFTSRLIRLFVKVIRQGNAQLLRDMAKALPVGLHGKPYTETTRRLIQATGKLRKPMHELTIRQSAELCYSAEHFEIAGEEGEPTTARVVKNIEARKTEVRAEGPMRKPRLTKYKKQIEFQDEQPTYSSVLSDLEKITGKKRTGLNAHREMKKAHLESASKANPQGLPRGKPGRQKKRERYGQANQV